VPYWLTGCSIDEIQDERYADFNGIRGEFMRVLEEQERGAGAEVSQVIREMWDSKGVWFWYCLSSVNAMYFLLEGHLCPPGSLSTSVERAVSQFWCENPEAVVGAKLAEREEYDAELNRVHGVWRMSGYHYRRNGIAEKKRGPNFEGRWKLKLTGGEWRKVVIVHKLGHS
jgi:hypothetical protein